MVRIIAFASGKAPQLLIPARGLIIALACWSAAALVWGLAEASLVKLRTVNIPTSKLPAGSPGLRVLQISDLHLSPYMWNHKLNRVLSLINEAKPDMIVFTGDILDSTGPETVAHLQRFAALRPELGKFAVLGNHEYYTGVKECVELMESAGVQMLRGASQKVKLPGSTNCVIVAGVDDSYRAVGRDASIVEDYALPISSRNDFVIFLKHQPIVADKSAGRFDLQLSGHSHGGQVFPFQIPVRLTYHHLAGLHAIPGGGLIYISRGAGTWGPPVRLFAPPEVTLFTISTESR